MRLRDGRELVVFCDCPERAEALRQLVEVDRQRARDLARVERARLRRTDVDHRRTGALGSISASAFGRPVVLTRFGWNDDEEEDG